MIRKCGFVRSSYTHVRTHAPNRARSQARADTCTHVCTHSRPHTQPSGKVSVIRELSHCLAETGSHPTTNVPPPVEKQPMWPHNRARLKSEHLPGHPSIALHPRFPVQPGPTHRRHPPQAPGRRAANHPQVHLRGAHPSRRIPLDILHVCLAKNAPTSTQILEITIKGEQMDDEPPGLGP